jgi:hypothetical protein
MIELTSKEIEAVHSTIEMELHPCASQERASEIAGFVRGLLLESLKYDTGMGTKPADGAAHDVDRATIRVMTKALDELVSACTDETGAPKAPYKKALMKARAMLPAWCANSLTKPTAKQA